jgi:hypothetical protein
LDAKKADDAATRAEGARAKYQEVIAAARAILELPPPPPPVTHPAPESVPESLDAAAKLFAKADYAGVEKELAGTKFDHDYELRSEVLRAAAWYARYLVGGRTDKATMTEAQNHVRRAHELDPKFQPDPILYSPAFLTFYRDTR